MEEIEALVRENGLDKEILNEAKEEVYDALMAHRRHDDALAFAKKFGL